jgi:N-acetylmuramoyl-L-alanine amidase
LNELYFDTLKRGLIRYTHGIFDNRETANVAKNRIVEIGIKDAFVIPYFNKRYISAAEAERLIKNDVSILVNKNLLTLNTNTNGGSTDIKTNTTSADISKLRFKVQLGVFRKSVPVEIMSMYLKLASKGIEETKIAETTVYSIGNYDSYEAANAVKTEALSMGVTDAFVAAYNDGKKIALEEALRLLGKK